MNLNHLAKTIPGKTDQSTSGPTASLPAFGANTVDRRRFLKSLGIAGAALASGAGVVSAAMGGADDVFPDHDEGPITRGDVAILKFLAAAEILETDLWQQYTEISLGNEPFFTALQVLDGDMPTYVNQNTRDERSHETFLNAFLMSIGEKPVSLEAFRTLPSSQATGANKSAKRLTSLMNLTVDTSWFLRYRGAGNPDFGDTFPQIASLVNVPGIPNSDLTIGGDDIQFIANTAGFHFATIEQGGSSLYDSLLPKVSNTDVVRIVSSIGGTEIMHFQLWQDKAGNAPPVPASTGARFPQLPVAPANAQGVTIIPGDGTDPSQPNFTNQIMPFPCKFLQAGLTTCSLIRPTSTAQAGASATVNGFTASGLFAGQAPGFFTMLNGLATAADNARR